MRTCPFCNYDEGQLKETSLKKPIIYRIECNACGACGPSAKTQKMAIEKWDGLLAKIESDEEFEEVLREDAMGGVSAPMATLNNTPGMGNAVPASSTSYGTGDSWGANNKIYTQAKSIKGNKKTKTVKGKKKSNKKKIEEDNINPYDKIGTSIARKMKVKMPFKKSKSKTNQNSMKNIASHQITPLSTFIKNFK